MNLFARMPSVPDVEEEDEVTPVFEIPTTPGNRAARGLYDRDLHELVGRLLGDAVKQAKRVRALRGEVRMLRLELRAITRRQTAIIGTAAIAVQGLLEAWRAFH